MDPKFGDQHGLEGLPRMRWGPPFRGWLALGWKMWRSARLAQRHPTFAWLGTGNPFCLNVASQSHDVQFGNYAGRNRSVGCFVVSILTYSQVTYEKSTAKAPRARLCNMAAGQKPKSFAQYLALRGIPVQRPGKERAAGLRSPDTPNTTGYKESKQE